jgi:hypothetical protein
VVDPEGQIVGLDTAVAATLSPGSSQPSP